MRLRTWIWSRVALAVMLVLLAACSRVDDLVSASDFQSEILADGHVTFDEYGSAVAAEIACLEQSGLQVDGPNLSASGRMLSFDTIAKGDGRPEEEFEAALDETLEKCSTDFSSHVVQEWLRETTPSEEEMRASFRDLLGCLERSGVDISEASAPEDLPLILSRIGVEDPLPKTALECIDRFVDLTITVDSES